MQRWSGLLTEARPDEGLRLLRPLVIAIAAVALSLPGAYSVATAALATPGEPAPVELQTFQGDGGGILSAVAPTTVPGAPPVTTVTGNDDEWHTSTVTLHLTVADGGAGVAYTTYQVGDGAWEKGTTIKVTAAKDHSNDGVVRVRFYSVGGDGAVEPEKSVTVKIDTTPPAFRWTAVSPSVIEGTRPVTLSFVVRDLSPTVEIDWRAIDQYGSFAAAKKSLQRDTGSRSIEVVPRYRSGKAFEPGLYRVRLTIADEAGNTVTTGEKVFRDYRAAPAKVWRRVSGAGKRIALTFDDGGAGPWGSILDTFKRYGMHGTFFPLGPYVAASPGLARRTLAEGHAIGSHGWTHTDMTRQSYAQVVRELTRSEAPWWTAAQATPVQYCRPPYGSYNGTTLAAARSTGFSRVMLWDVDPRDWSQPGAGTITSRVLSHVHSGAIVCMHLTPQTAAALPAILSGLKARGYRAVSLPELFRAAGYR
jgi:peptidoglycan/xylan/chitin deacetylase (PgdA/CDA1 family)